MALSPDVVSATIQTNLVAEFGPPEDAAKMKAFADGLAIALIEILTTQMTVSDSGAVS